MSIIQIMGSIRQNSSIGTHWISNLSSVNSFSPAYNSIDSSGNVYITSTTPSNASILIAKYNVSGVLQWQRILNSSGNDTGKRIVVDSSGNVYITGSPTGVTYSFILAAKYDTNGTLQWQRSLGVTSNNNYGESIAIDNSANVYVGGYSSSLFSGSTAVIAKYDTSGTLQWQKYLANFIFPGNSQSSVADLDVDSSGNIYLVTTGLVIAKYNTSGTLQWQKLLSSGSESGNVQSISIDSSGNIYIVGQSYNSGEFVSKILIIKCDSNGDVLWQKKLDYSGADSPAAYDVCVDSSQNVYVLASANISGNVDSIILKYDMNGNLQWQRSFGNPSYYENGSTISVDSVNNNIYASLFQYDNVSTRSATIAKLPSDGSKTGTYGGYVYANSSYVESTPSFVSSTSTLTPGDSTLTASTPTLTSSTSSLTSSTVNIP